jgi:hypothetical protein
MKRRFSTEAARDALRRRLLRAVFTALLSTLFGITGASCSISDPGLKTPDGGAGMDAGATSAGGGTGTGGTVIGNGGAMAGGGAIAAGGIVQAGGSPVTMPTGKPDASAPPQDSGTGPSDGGAEDACVPNACGGCGALLGAPDSPCGKCGKYVCAADKRSVTCSDPGLNACNGCGTLAAAPGASCGTCGTYVCSANKSNVSCSDPGTTNSCPTWCTSHPAPSGVAASDYQCIDFDNGFPASSTWVLFQRNNGTYSRSTARASSTPASLAMTVGDVSDPSKPDTAEWTWNNTGSAPIKSVNISMEISPATLLSLAPAWTGQIDLACFHSGSNFICLSYTYGEVTSWSSSYVGLLLNVDYSGGIAFHNDCQVTKDLTRNIWNTVQITATWSTGALQVLVNGTNAVSNCTAGFDPDTNASIWYGMDTSGGVSVPYSMYYDNIQVTVRR